MIIRSDSQPLSIQIEELVIPSIDDITLKPIETQITKHPYTKRDTKYWRKHNGKQK